MSSKAKPRSRGTVVRKNAPTARPLGSRPADFDRAAIIALLAPLNDDVRREHSPIFSGAVLAGLDLSGINFSKVTLERVCFAGCNLTNASFCEAELYHADFRGAILTDTDFAGAMAAGSTFAGSTIKSAEFNLADCSECDFTGATIDGAYVTGTNLFIANFFKARLKDVRFVGSILGRNNWAGAKLTKCSFWGAQAAGHRDPNIRPDDLPPGADWKPEPLLPATEPATPTEAATAKASPTDVEPDKTATPAGSETLPEWPQPTYDVWEAWEQNFGSAEQSCAGFIVTAKGDPSRLIAFVRRWPGDNWHRTVAQAKKIATYPQYLEARDYDGWDLRDYCRLDSLAPTPMEFYTYKIARPGAGGKESVPLLPFCRFRLAKLVAMHNRLWLTPEERETMVFDQIGAGEAPAEAPGKSVTRSIIITAEALLV